MSFLLVLCQLVSDQLMLVWLMSPNLMCVTGKSSHQICQTQKIIRYLTRYLSPRLCHQHDWKTIIFQNLLDLKNNFNSNLTLIFVSNFGHLYWQRKGWVHLDQLPWWFVQEEFSLQTKCNHDVWYSKKLWSYNHFNDALPVATEMCHLNTSNNGCKWIENYKTLT